MRLQRCHDIFRLGADSEFTAPEAYAAADVGLGQFQAHFGVEAPDNCDNFSALNGRHDF